MHSAALWLQASERARNEHFITLSVGLEYHGQHRRRPDNPEDSAPHPRGAQANERLLAESERPRFGAATWHPIESSDFTVTYGLFGKDDWRETLSTLRTR